MKQTRALMGMTITVEIADSPAAKTSIDKVFSYFENVENKFSVFKTTSEITLINNGKIKENQWSEDMKLVFAFAEKTKKETNGYFDIVATDGKYNPSGLVKGWSVYNASKLLLAQGFKNFYVEAGGDIQAHGKNEQDRYWSVGIKVVYSIVDIPSTSYYQAIREKVPDWQERFFYISGPPSMVSAFETNLKKIGVKKSHIKTDYFPGFA